MDEFLFWIAGGYGIRPYVFRIAVYMQCILTSSAGASPSPVAIIDCSPLWLRPLRHANACQSSAPVAIIDCSPLWLQTVHWTVCLTRRAQSERLSLHCLLYASRPTMWQYFTSISHKIYAETLTSFTTNCDTIFVAFELFSK